MYLLDTDTLIYSFKDDKKVTENIKNHADAPTTDSPEFIGW